ncbi:hypothetical protein [Piscinibacter sp. HJYY11]|uniref:hypothetical protein n=1 Tax=Piscinibacter sp. HJYY11 TaxID=2801333 RepID=UPI00191EF6A8|nr:hypothetical protein [Piscinibacter sp. HJYY11]MBL0727702.1 hypothetical protein [Piscinibacter sp. HJYY11]
MKRISLAAAGFTLSCLLAACGGGSDTDTSVAQAADTRSDSAQADLRREAQAQARPRPEQFTAGPREVNDTIVWQQQETTVGGTTQQRSYGDRITAVEADGSFSFNRGTPGGVTFERYRANADGNRLSREYVNNGNHCTYDPNRNFVSYPLYVGKVWASQWNYNCSLGYKERATQLSAVTGRESITIQAGTFDALRIGYVTLYTKSNDVNLQNGANGEAAYLVESTCWWATSVKRIVKCTYKNTYFGTTPPAGYLADYALEASYIGKVYFPDASRQVGQSSRWTETDTQLGGNVINRHYTQTITAVNPDGSYNVDRAEANGFISERILNDRGGNRLNRFIVQTNNPCTWAPRRDYLSFPLYVGKTWTSGWNYSCALGYREDAAHTARVEALEPVTTAAGTFNALRVSFQTVLTNSNDFQLQNGPAGQATYRNDGTCWWDVDGQRIVKCDIANTFEGPAPATYRQRYVTELAAVLVP